ncbi:9413_t:CDS:1, partial [Entrophospora sp. SA101]
TWKNTTGKNITKRRPSVDNLQIKGILTSRIETREKGKETYYYGFFKLESQEGEIPVVFKNKPDLKKGCEVKLVGK